MSATSEHPSDSELRERVQQAIDTVLPYEGAHIGVGVKHATVTLTGTVLTRAERAAVVEATLAAGAQAIADGLLVEGDDLHPTDMQIALNLRRAVRHAERVSSDFVVPIVSHGQVVLTGEVANAEERDAALLVATHTRGVAGVESQLRIPTTNTAG